MTCLESAGFALPLAGKSPTEELEAIKVCAGLLGGEITVEFKGAKGGSVISAALSGIERPEDPQIAERVMRLAPFLISCDIPNWDQDEGSEGRIRIFSHEDPWIDAVDHNDDWLLERVIDTEALQDMSFEEEDASDDPQP